MRRPVDDPRALRGHLPAQVKSPASMLGAPSSPDGITVCGDRQSRRRSHRDVTRAKAGERVPDSAHEEMGFVQKPGRPAAPPGAGAREPGGSDGSLTSVSAVATGGDGICRSFAVPRLWGYAHGSVPFLPGLWPSRRRPRGDGRRSATAISFPSIERRDRPRRRARPAPGESPRPLRGTGARMGHASGAPAPGSNVVPTRTGSGADSGSGRCGLLLRAAKQPGSWSRSSWFAPGRHATGCARRFSCAG